MKKILALTTLVIATIAFAANTARAGEFPDITIGDLKKAIAEKSVTVVDVNGTESWEKGHIPSAIDYEATEEKFAQLLPKNKDALVVAYCGGPSCLAYREAARVAKKLGYTNVKHLSAGITGWKDAGEKTEQGK